MNFINKFKTSWVCLYLSIFTVIAIYVGGLVVVVNLFTDFHPDEISNFILYFIDEFLGVPLALSGAVAIASFVLLITTMFVNKKLCYSLAILVITYIGVCNHKYLAISQGSSIYFAFYFLISIPFVVVFFIIPLIILFLLEFKNIIPPPKKDFLLPFWLIKVFIGSILAIITLFICGA